ncbi:hypothetical protein ACFYO5_22130 [Streptomyces sp. NPDC006259]|uniref:hypothetical protein n=1 Tax=Streptomyces sp. NPDC006259 TaxID=3364740 RepID=UPI0036AA646E
MTDRDDHQQAPASGMRADHQDHLTEPDAGWPQHTGTEGDAVPEGTSDALEEDPSVRKAMEDDTSAPAFVREEADDDGPLTPEFREPTDRGDGGDGSGN